MIHQVFFYLSILQGFISQGVGIYAIFKGTYKPHRTTRLIYFIMSIFFVGTLIAQKSWDSLGFAAAQNFGGAIIFLLSFKYGIGGYEKNDIVTLICAFITGTVWIATNDPTLALIMSIITSLIAFIPTFVKILKLPKTEEWRFYFSDVLGSGFSLLSQRDYVVKDILYPSYIFIANMLTTLLVITLNQEKRRKAKS